MADYLFVALGINSADELRPLIELARKLLAARTQVGIITHGRYSEILSSEGVAFLDGGPCPFQARSQTPEGRALDAPPREGETMTDRLSAFMRFLTREWITAGKAHLGKQGTTSAILASPTATFVYPSVCESLGLGIVLLDSSPAARTAEFGPPRGYGSSQAGFRWVNQQRWDAHAKSMWACLYRDGVNAARGSLLGLGPDCRELGPAMEGVPVLLTYSSTLLPRPLEWAPNIRVVGALLPAAGSVPSTVRAFMEGAAESCVYVAMGEALAAFGTQSARQDLLSACIASIRSAGHRAIVVVPPSYGVAAEPLRSPNCLVIAKRPTLAAEMAVWAGGVACVLCSGDPWTVHAAAAVGVPVCTVDFGRDDTPEAFWGARVAASGIGPSSVPARPEKGAVGPLLEAAIKAAAVACKDKAAATSAAMGRLKGSLSEGVDAACAALTQAMQEAVVPSSKAPSGTAAPPAASADGSAAAASGSGSEEVSGGGGRSGGATPAAAAEVEAQAEVNDGRRPAGFSFDHRGMAGDDPKAEAAHVWRRGDDSAFRVRCGPNYKKNGKKAPSGPSLYELVHVDFFKSKKAVTNLEAHLRFPTVAGRDTHHKAVPPLLVINGVLPLEAPSMLSSSSDGPTLHAVFYYAIKQSTCDALASIAEAPSAVKLLQRWCSRAETHPETFAKFKCIGMVRNYDQAGMPTMFKSFNGKPILIRNSAASKGGSGLLRRGPTSLEMAVNIRSWPYMAKQGLGYLLSGLDKCDLDIGFVLEGGGDEELPEVLLGSVRLSHLKLKAIADW